MISFFGRHRNLKRQCPSPFLVNGSMCGICNWLHALAFVCLSFKGMEIVALSNLATWLYIHPSVVVGFRFLENNFLFTNIFRMFLTLLHITIISITLVQIENVQYVVWLM